jgi:hypothetical protein
VKGASVQKRLRRTRLRKAAIARSVEVRKLEAGIAGVLPMVESAAAKNSVRLRATERREAFSGAS